MPYYQDENYIPELAPGFNPFEAVEPDEDEAPIDVWKLKRPKFPEEVRAELERRANPTSQVALNQYPVLFYTCGACGSEGEGHLMHIGHIVTWQNYIDEKGPLSIGAALAAYCDLQNLRFEHAICNTSHQFEDGPVDNSGDVFADLINKYAPPSKGVASEAVRVGSKQLRLPAGRTKHRGATLIDAFDYDEDDRPKFYAATRDALVAEWYMKNQAQVGANAKGAKVPLFYCVSCKKYCEAFSMQLGHKVMWKTYAQDCGAVTRAEVTQAFNDLNNLEFQCSACNQGHEWEEWNFQDEDFHYSDGDLLEKENDETQMMEDNASFIENQVQIDAPIYSKDQQAILHLMVMLNGVGEALPTLPKFASMAQAIGRDIVFLSTEALKKRLTAGYASTLPQQQAEQYSEVGALALQNEVVAPVLKAWNEDPIGQANPVTPQELDAFRTALFSGHTGLLPDPITLFGRKVAISDIVGCAEVFKKASTEAQAVVQSHGTFAEHLNDQPVDLSATTIWVQGFQALPHNATHQIL